MGVINMAHGEMLMIGAYATFVVQNLFIKYLPSFFDWYLIVAIPVSFLASAIVGIILERTSSGIFMVGLWRPFLLPGESAWC